MKVLLISTYELGRPSFGLAEPAAWLRETGADVACLDLAVEQFDAGRVRGADLIAFHVPMHTATRLALEILPRVRALNPGAHLCFYGLYAPVNEAHLRGRGAGTVLGGEFEEGLTALVRRLGMGGDRQVEPVISLHRQRFRVPDRSGLPPLSLYAKLVMPDGEERLAGYTEASRGCRHLCRHCPVVPVYRGRFRVVARDVVLEDIRRQVAAGARHVTFGDADFFNGPGHVIPIVEALRREWPELTYDATIKVEHLLRHADLLPVLKRTGCLFVTTAVESVDDAVLKILRKGHTRLDVEEVLRRFDGAGLDLSPTFVSFTPWTSRRGYCDFLQWLVDQDLADRVAPIQLAIRLLIPPGSVLLELPEVRRLAGALQADRLIHPWTHADSRMDALAAEVSATVETREAAGADRRDIFAAIWRAAHALGGVEAPTPQLPPGRPSPPRMSEPWYCCAEPTSHQMTTV